MQNIKFNVFKAPTLSYWTENNDEQLLQQEYYQKTASKYHETHVIVGDEHYISLSYISALIKTLSITSVLDIGCGTGRGVEYIQKLNPDVKIIGIEPIQALLDVGVKNGISPKSLFRASGLALPFTDKVFDAVIELGILHHVNNPGKVVMEMLRAAKKAVFISDSNIFAQGCNFVKLLKLFLYKIGLWRVAKFIQTGGKGYTISEGDGLAYSYSVYFQYELLANWADRIIVIPIRSPKKVSHWWSPLLTADTVLLCAIRDDRESQ